MLCEKCKMKEATVRYTYTVNQNSLTYALCRECYQEISGTDKLFSGWLFPQSISGMKSHQDIKKCDLCGYTLDRIASENRVGCARCYRTFEKELAPLISRIHGNKVYVANHDETKQASALDDLKLKLERAIESENYEEAAVLRDKIRKLKEDSQ